MLSVVGLALCITFAWFSAPDLALTQLRELDSEVGQFLAAENGRLDPYTKAHLSEARARIASSSCSLVIARCFASKIAARLISSAF